MLGERICKALDEGADAYLESAMHVYERKKKTRKTWLRVAACAAVLALLIGAMFFWPATEENYITGPGVLVVRAYETDEPTLSDENSVLLQEGITVPMEYTYHPGISWTEVGLGLPFRFSIPEKEYVDEEITFEIWLSGGDFRHLDYSFVFDNTADSYAVARATFLGDHFTIPNNKKLWWNRTRHVFDDQNREVHYVELDTDRVFVDLILRADDHIIGYAVIEIVDVGASRFGFTYHTCMLKSVSFPKVEGKYQTVSEAYVKKQFQIVHDQA